MLIDPELVRQMEIAIAARRQALAIMATSARLQRLHPARTKWGPAPVRQRSFPLLSIAEKLIDAHAFAKIEGDGTTIDVILDALHHVGKRLAKETDADGRSARTILGHYRQQHDCGADRDRPLPE